MIGRVFEHDLQESTVSNAKTCCSLRVPSFSTLPAFSLGDEAECARADLAYTRDITLDSWPSRMRRRIPP